ncbi:MAG TPA: hypothetical protein VF545_00630 [Thermoleophilaceae bacterium]|jgi:hypothetical protein
MGAYEYLKRYNEPDEIPYLVKMSRFVKVAPEHEGARLLAWEERMSFEARLEIVALNFWEELAGM